MIPEIILFTSPKAGSGAARDQIPRLAELLEQAKLTFHEISSPDELSQLLDQTQQNRARRPIVIAAGGDGTISLVASLCDSQTPILPMPLGTENLLAKHFGHHNDADSVLTTIQNGKAVRLDAGEANGRLFLIMATVGFDAEVVRRLHLRRKGHIRRASYYGPILKALLKYRFPKLVVSQHDPNGRSIGAQQVSWAMVFNLPCYAASLQIAPDAIGDDGKLDLVTFARRGMLNGVRYVLAVALGRHHRLADVQQHPVSEVLIESDARVAYELDGDYAGRLPLEIKTLRQRVTLMVPPN